MNLSIEKMTEKQAREILGWEYEAPYDFYNNETTDEALAELTDGSYSAIFDDTGALFGYFCVGKSAQVPAGYEYGACPCGFIDMGLGMHPNKVGKGNGFEFVSFIMQYIKNTAQDQLLRLTVAAFNHRAIHLYEKLGFTKRVEFSTDFANFFTMVRD